MVRDCFWFLMPAIPSGVRSSVSKRYITIGERIETTTANRFEQALKRITAKDKEKPVIIFLRGEKGGDVYACLKIYQLLVTNPAPVITVAIDVVFSGFFFILEAGRFRFGTKKTRFIFHRAVQFFEGERLNTSDLHEYADLLYALDGTQIIIFSSRGRPVKKVIELFKRGATLGTLRALELKLIDGTVRRNSIPRMCEEILRKIKMS